MNLLHSFVFLHLSIILIINNCDGHCLIWSLERTNNFIFFVQRTRSIKKIFRLVTWAENVLKVTFLGTGRWLLMFDPDNNHNIRDPHDSGGSNHKTHNPTANWKVHIWIRRRKWSSLSLYTKTLIFGSVMGLPTDGRLAWLPGPYHEG